MSEFACRVESTDDATVLVLSGEIGLEVAEELRERALEAIAGSSHPVVVLDLADVSFLDSTGIGTFVLLRRKVLDAGKEFAVRGVPGRLARLFAITGLTEAFPVRD